MDVHVIFGLRLIIATVLGGAIGLQRELSGKPAGLRTNLLICLGACLFTQLSIDLQHVLNLGDPARIAAQILPGIGFIGAGTIIQSRHVVHGLTSAATIWVVAGVGMAAGAGFERQAALGTVLILIALAGLGRLEHRILGQQVIAVTLRFGAQAPEPQELLARAGVRRRILSSQWASTAGGAGTMTVSWRGAPVDVEAVRGALAGFQGVAMEAWEVEE